ncbi:MAG: recombination regulator RecX [Clostridium sp.]|nr:recombination regulator RecX [Clostridium sp.]
MGKITKIEVQKRNKERVNVYIDNAYAFSIYSELVYRENLRVNSEVDEEKLLSLAKKENVSKCKETALKIIERSYKTEKEMQKKLMEKGYDFDSIEIVINFLKEYNFINDSNYVKMYIKDRISTQGKQKIKYSLIRKGISVEIIDEFINKIESDDEKVVAIEMTKKKYKTLIKRENDRFKLWNKLCRYLVGRGYDYSISKEVVNEVLDMENID